MRNCLNILTENEIFARDFFEGSTKVNILNILFGKLNTLISKKNTRMLGVDYFWYLYLSEREFSKNVEN